MIKKVPAFFLLFFMSLYLSSQNTRVLISGNAKNTSFVPIKDVHIINLNSKLGTVTDTDGLFEIAVSKGDSLLVSSIQYQNEVIIITSKIINEKKLMLHLLVLTNQLKEVFVKKKMTKVLGIDLKKTPVDRKAEALKKTMDFSKIDMKVVEADDYIDKHVRPPVINTDPVGNFGSSAKAFIPFKDSEKLWALRRKLAYNKGFPFQIKSELGDNFFFKQLKIPKERFYHFLEYCNPLGIEQLYKNNNILEVIKILRKESESYLKLIEKNK